ncbi:MAG: M20/M25/M40 family metallo-hydrolase [Ignavibacteriales bacterium]|nr:M20/M25/M40 family metallo-hydrolase [Ignavibacteriales bacterium]
MQRRYLIFISAFVMVFSSVLVAQSPAVKKYNSLAVRIAKEALGSNNSFDMLEELCANIGNRISGSPQATKAILWAKTKMEEFGFENVHLEPVMVPHWVRGPVEEAYLLLPSGQRERLKIAALGGSIATPPEGITAEVIEVKSFDELQKLGGKAKGKIVFFNRPMDRTLFQTFAAYGGAVDQRGHGAVMAARVGGVAALVRSMTTRIDDSPHTGAMGYVDTVNKVPSAAISTRGAEYLSKILSQGIAVRIQLKLSAQTLPDVESANVVGELRGTEKPNEVIIMGGHLDSWDIGYGAQDDGAGCIQSLEALRLLKKLGLKPKRTIRAVMFMNEENGGRGGTAYAAKDRPGEKHIAAIESDAGGFSPRGFGIGDTLTYTKVAPWGPLLRSFGADQITLGGGGSDISPLGQKGVPMI